MSTVIPATAAATATFAVTAPLGQHESLLQRFTHTEAQALTVMEAVGRDCLQLLTSVQKYLPAASAIATAIFPADSAAIASTTRVIELIQDSVATVEAKWAAGNLAGKSGPQKLADVLALVEAPATELLSTAGIKANTQYITNLINLVVSMLNVRTMPTN